MGFLEVVTLIFIIAKVAGAIDWSWWLVFSPLYVYVFAAIAWILVAVATSIAGAIAAMRK